MSNTFQVETHYQVKYTNREPLPIADIVQSLESYERLLRRTPAFIEKAFDGITVTKIDVYVSSLESGSLTEDFLIKFVFKGQENYDEAKEVFNKIMQDNEVLRTAVAVGVGAIITFGAIKILPAGAPTTHIEANNNNIITIGGQIDLSADDIHTILDKLTDKKKLAQDVVQVILPSRRDSSASIEIEGFSDLNITPEFVSEAPSEYIAPEPEEKTVEYNNADVVIYASDRDKADKVWAGIVPGIADTRVQFTLNPGIDPKALHGKVRIKADISVISKFNKPKKIFKPRLVEIKRVY